MKTALLLFFIATTASAHQITGTPILKGSLKTKIIVNTIETECRIKVEKVKNLLEEDSFENPAYNVRVEVALSGRDVKKKIEVKHNREYWFKNLFPNGSGTIVKDYEYFTEDGSTLEIKTDGRLKTVQFPFEGRRITCNF